MVHVSASWDNHIIMGERTAPKQNFGAKLIARALVHKNWFSKIIILS